MVLSKAKDYYKNNKERLREEARDKYRNLSEEEKNLKKKRIWGKKKKYWEKKYFWGKETNTKRISKKLSWGKKVSI